MAKRDTKNSTRNKPFRSSLLPFPSVLLKQETWHCTSRLKQEKQMFNGQTNFILAYGTIWEVEKGGHCVFTFFVVVTMVTGSLYFPSEVTTHN